MKSPAYQKLKDTKSLPSPTGVAMEILRLAGDEKATLEQISKVAESDPALAARLLKLVNSPFAGVRRKIASISEAVRLLGLRTVKNLALGLSLVSNNRSGSCTGFDFEAFWSESLARGVAARHLTGHLKNFASDEGFAIGLLSKIGRLALAAAYPLEYADVLVRSASEQSERLYEIEREAFGIDQNLLSSEMMLDWRLHDLFCIAVRDQDANPDQDAPEDRTRQFTRILRLAGAIASALMQSLEPSESISQLTNRAAPLGISTETLTTLIEEISQEWKEAGRIFSISTREGSPLDLHSVEQTVSEINACEPPDVKPASPKPSDPLRVLVVDDDAATRRLIEKYLTDAGCRVSTAGNGAQALELDCREPVQMILTDWNMPEIDGLDLCRRLRANDSGGFVYIIVLTASTEKSRAVEALDAGADDFLSKPFERHELLAHVRAGERIIRLEARVAERSREISEFNARLAGVNDKLRVLATTDELTGLLNRRETLARLAEHWALAERHEEPLSCIQIDIDHFKQVNDTHGHSVGDLVLKRTSAALRRSARAGEMVSRMGGEEFLVVCPKSTLATAQLAADRLRLAVAANTIKAGEIECSVTISLGVAERKPSMTDPQDMLKAADEALYRAKQAGRNRVCTHGSDSTTCAPIPAPAGKASPSPGQPSPTDGALSANILLIDDDPQIRMLCRRILELDGCKVREAADALTGIEMACNSPPDIIVLDLQMPGLDGLECTRRLREQASTRDVPILMLSSAGDAENIESGLACGADEYITKPVRHREFVLRVRSLTRLHRSKLALIASNETRWEQARTLQTLLDLSCSLVRSTSLEEILNRIVSAAADLTQSRRISIMLPDATAQHLFIAGSTDAQSGMTHSVRVPVGSGIAGKVFLSGDPIVANSVEDAKALAIHGDSRFFISVPMICQLLRASDHIVGVLNITDRHAQGPFSPAEIESIDLLCNIAASGINEFLSRESIESAQDAIVVALATLAEYRDLDTGRHLDRVTHYTTLLAEELAESDQFVRQINDEFLRDLKRAVPLHDIGKVGVPDDILLKPGRLSDEQMAEMRRHSDIGARTIRSVRNSVPQVNFLSIAEDIAWCHHERWDGSGYPRGIGGDDIPLPARLVAVADVYDALTSKRVYKQAIPHERAVRIIQEASGSHFDPQIVQAFLNRQTEFARICAELADDCEANEPAEALITS